MPAPTSIEAFLYCLNETNLSTIDLTQVEISEPTVSTENLEFNTKITVTASEDGPYRGSQTHYYNRLPLTDLLGEFELSVADDGALISDVVAALNAIHHTGLTADDIENWDTPIGDIGFGDGIEVMLKATENSYAWVGEAAFTVVSDRIDIKSVLSVSELNGLTLEMLTDSEEVE